jgi:hypothetical protein
MALAEQPGSVTAWCDQLDTCRPGTPATDQLAQLRRVLRQLRFISSHASPERVDPPRPPNPIIAPEQMNPGAGSQEVNHESLTMGSDRGRDPCRVI